MSEYDDIRALKTTGMWPGGKTPEWAAKLGERLQLMATHPAVIAEGLVAEIGRLRDENEQLRVRLTNMPR